MRILIILLSLTLLCGCQLLSLDMERAVLRGSGDISATILLDNTKMTPAKVVAISEKILKFLNSEDAPSFPIDKVENYLMGLVPPAYQSLVEMAMSRISAPKVNVKAIGKDNILRISAFIKGVMNGAKEYIE